MCSSVQAGVCAAQLAAGESGKEGQSVRGSHSSNACHCFSPAPRMLAPVQTRCS